MKTVDPATAVADPATGVASPGATGVAPGATGEPAATGLAATAAKVPIPRDVEVALARDLERLFARFAEEIHAWEEFVNPDYQADEQEVLLTKLMLTEAAPYLIQEMQEALHTHATDLAVSDDRVGNSWGVSRQAAAKRRQLRLRRGAQK